MINETEATIISKFLNLFLGHKPQIIELTLDEQGWASVAKLVEQMNKNGFAISTDMLDYVVASAAQRFTYNDDKTRIKASEWYAPHTVSAGFTPQQPPAVLYHGTGKRSVPSILSKGIDKRTRQHVHLSADKETALASAQRHGLPYLFVVAAAEMHRDGHSFYFADNKVWLTHHVPAQYLQLAGA